MKYKCSFPNCGYVTEKRSKIEFHHITPQEVIRSSVTLPFCPTHHRLIYHPLASSGCHSSQTNDSLEIVGLFESTHGKAIHYKDLNGKMFYYIPFDGTIIKD